MRPFEVVFIWSGDMRTELARVDTYVIPNSGHLIEIEDKTYRVVSVTWRLANRIIHVLVG